MGRFVVTRPDRGDTLAAWPCRGRVVLALPAALVAELAPGGSVVEAVTPAATRLHLGAWSWAGIAGVVATFDGDVADVRPTQLREACRRVARRLTSR